MSQLICFNLQRLYEFRLIIMMTSHIRVTLVLRTNDKKRSADKRLRS